MQKSVVCIIVWLLACVSACEKGTSTPAAPAAMPQFVHYPLLAVPPAAVDIDRDIKMLQRRKQFDELPPKYEELLRVLNTTWGARDSRTAPYHYNYCVTLKLLSRDAECLKAVDRALEIWPNSLQHRLLSATTRMTLSGRRGTLIRGTEPAVEAILNPLLHSSISNLRVEPAQLHVQWASLLYMRAEFQKALQHCDAALALKPAAGNTLELKARCLMALKRPREVLASIPRESLESGSLPVRLLAGTAHQALGEFDEAWKALAPGIGHLDELGDTSLASEYRTQTATTLNQLRRFEEARSLLLIQLTIRPLDTKSMYQMTTALRGLKKAQLSAALLRRSQELAAYEHHQGEAKKSQRAGQTASISFHESLAFVEIDRIGHALDILRKPIREYPKLLIPRLFEVELLLQIGDVREALKRNLQALRETESPTIRAVQARLLNRLGQVEEARSILKSLENQPSLSPRSDALSRAFSARAALEIGDTTSVRKFIKNVDEGLYNEPEAKEIALLSKSYMLLSEGKPQDASNLLSTEITHTPGGGSWRGAIQALAAAIATDVAPSQDISDLVEQPWLVARAKRFSFNSDASKDLLQKAETIIVARNSLLSSLSETREDMRSPIWLELIDLYSNHRAQRKRRETAWYRWNYNRGELANLQALLEALNRDEEIFSRRHLVQNALKIHNDPKLYQQLQDIDDRLGVIRK